MSEQFCWWLMHVLCCLEYQYSDLNMDFLQKVGFLVFSWFNFEWWCRHILLNHYFIWFIPLLPNFQWNPTLLYCLFKVQKYVATVDLANVAFDSWNVVDGEFSCLASNIILSPLWARCISTLLTLLNTNTWKQIPLQILNVSKR